MVWYYCGNQLVLTIVAVAIRDPHFIISNTVLQPPPPSGTTIVASIDPLPSSEPPTEAVDGHSLMDHLKSSTGLAGRDTNVDGTYKAEMDAMTVSVGANSTEKRK